MSSAPVAPTDRLDAATAQPPSTSLARVKVAAFTGGAKASSARFRVRQYIPALAQGGVEVVEYGPSLGSYPPEKRWQRLAWGLGTLGQRLPQICSGWAADITLLHREMVSTLCTLEGLTRHPRLIDVDDAIHLFRGGWPAKQLAKRADLVVVGNNCLAEAWQKWNTRVENLPTPVDTELYHVKPPPELPCIGWLGSFGNLRYLEGIAPALTEVIRPLPRGFNRGV